VKGEQQQPKVDIRRINIGFLGGKKIGSVLKRKKKSNLRRRKVIKEGGRTEERPSPMTASESPLPRKKNHDNEKATDLPLQNGSGGVR